MHSVVITPVLECKIRIDILKNCQNFHTGSLYLPQRDITNDHVALNRVLHTKEVSRGPEGF